MLLFKDLGKLDYADALSVQEQIVEKKIKGELSADVLLLLEHFPVFTLGKSGKEAHLLDREAPLCRTRRGGDITYHGPGQLVVYPIIDLRSKRRKEVHRYLYGLERSAIRLLEDFGIYARRNPPCTGVWVEERKIAFIGIAVRRGMTSHGVALNVDLDLAPFRRIVPCGLPGVNITSMKQELGREVSLERVKMEFAGAFARVFGYSEVQALCLEDTQIGSRSDSPEAPIISGSKGF